MNKSTLIRRLYNFFLTHWLLSAIVVVLPFAWLSLTILLGMRKVGTLTTDIINPNTLYFFFLLSILSLLFAMLKFFGDAYNNRVKDNGLIVLEMLLRSVNSITQKKLQRFHQYIVEHRGKPNLNPFQDITQPIKQIEIIFQNIQIALSRISGIYPEDIGLSIIYRTDKNPKWNWVLSKSIEEDITLDELITNEKTTARQIIDRRATSLFFPDKRIAAIQGKYLPGNKDKAHGLIGSILCKDISLRNEDTYLHAILSVTTYGKQLCDHNDIETIQKIEHLIIPCFEYRLALELSLFYIKTVLAQQN